MTSRESKSQQREWDDPQHEHRGPIERGPSIWPLVLTFVAAFAIRQVLSMKRRFQNFEQYARQGNTTRPGNNSRPRYYYTIWTSDKGGFYGRDGFVWRERGGNDDPWSRFWKEGFLDIEELERLERIRRMQEAFLRENMGYARTYERWQHESERAGASRAQQAGREDWYWGRAGQEAWQNANQGRSGSSQWAPKSPQAHNYNVLGLDPSRAGTYSQGDIKAAFRAKAMQYHPDRNQHRKDFAETKFREVVSAYEALKK